MIHFRPKEKHRVRINQWKTIMQMKVKRKKISQDSDTDQGK